MVKIRYEVLGQFEPEKDYGVHIPAQYAKCLHVITKANEEFFPTDIVKKHLSEFLRSNIIKFQIIFRSNIHCSPIENSSSDRSPIGPFFSIGLYPDWNLIIPIVFGCLGIRHVDYLFVQ